MKRRQWFAPFGLLAALGMTFSSVPVAGADTASATACAVTWGSQPKTSTGGIPGVITNVRAGRQDCYDRMVVDLTGNIGGFDVRYVNQIVTIGSGDVIPVRGGAKIQVVVFAPAHDDDYHPTYHPANANELVNVSGFATFRQLVLAGSFEGVTDFGIGVRARLPFRTFTLAGPGTSTRLVVDVAHQW